MRKRPFRQGLATSWHHFTWPLPNTQQRNEPEASVKVEAPPRREHDFWAFENQKSKKSDKKMEPK